VDCGRRSFRPRHASTFARVVNDAPLEEPTTIDLFCGAGGLVLGLNEAGFTTSLALDNWSPAVNTLAPTFRG
jgi:hypothetical protein